MEITARHDRARHRAKLHPPEHIFTSHILQPRAIPQAARPLRVPGLERKEHHLAPLVPLPPARAVRHRTAEEEQHVARADGDLLQGRPVLAAEHGRWRRVLRLVGAVKVMKGWRSAGPAPIATVASSREG
jgi:hypothetical protein